MEVGSAEWCDATTIVAESIGSLGDTEGIRSIARNLLAIPARKATAPLTTVCARVVTSLRRTGSNAEATQLLGHLREILTHVDNLDPRRKAFLHQMFSQEAFHAGEYGVMVAELEQSIRGSGSTS